jgi:hypothetical protein
VRARDLIALASARGINLQHVAQMQAPPARSDVEWKDFEGGRTAPVLVPPPTMRARATETRSFRRPQWTQAELALAANDVPPLCFSAALYAFAGDHSGYWILWGALTDEAHRLRERRGWSAQVIGENGHPKFYLSELASLVLDEDRYQDLFRRAPLLYWVCVGVSEKIWRSTVFERFDAVRCQFQSWCDRARSMIEQRLAESSEDQ